MSSGSAPTDSRGMAIVCREVFDEASQASDKEILEYARRLGIDPDREEYLLELAREGLMAALPRGWRPVFHEGTGAYYYYHESTQQSTWEHPMDQVYRNKVAEARAAQARGPSADGEPPSKPRTPIDDTSAGLTTSISLSAKPPPGPSVSTRIPLKLAPLRRHQSEIVAWGQKSRSRSGDSESSLTSPNSSVPEARSPGRSLPERISQVLKRSESLSPRHEKDWKQLNAKFGAPEDGVIDVDLRLDAVSPVRGKTEVPQKAGTVILRDKPVNQVPKELRLSGDGALFLKRNRSRDTTPSQEQRGLVASDWNGENRSKDDEEEVDENGGGADEHQDNGNEEVDCEEAEKTTASNNSISDRPRSILRDKPLDDDIEKPNEEERKSVRFDLKRISDISNDYLIDSEDDDESGDEHRGARARAEQEAAMKRSSNIRALQQILQRQASTARFDSKSQDSLTESLPNDNANKPSKIVARRFLVENVSDQEHLEQQQQQDADKSLDDELDSMGNKFVGVRKIDIVSRTTDSDCKTLRSDSEDSKSATLSKEPRRLKELILNFGQKARLKSPELPGLGLSERSSDDAEDKSDDLDKIESGQQNGDIKELRATLEAKLDETKAYLESEFNDQKITLQASMMERLAELKDEMADREEQEIQKLITDMDCTRDENLKKVRSELEACYEKERQDILNGLKSELERRKGDLLELRSQEFEKLKTEYAKNIDEDRVKDVQLVQLEHRERIETMRKELELEFEASRTQLRAQQREKIAKITEDHDKFLADILKDFRTDEALARKVYKERLEEIRADYSRDIENAIKKQNESVVRQEVVDFEKIRCEKRLLEDKYNILKEKYLKLKKDMRLAMERRQKRKEAAAAATAVTSGPGAPPMSEAEMSTSTRTRTERTESDKLALTKTNSSASLCSLPDQTKPPSCTAKEASGVGVHPSSSSAPSGPGAGGTTPTNSTALMIERPSYHHQQLQREQERHHQAVSGHRGNTDVEYRRLRDDDCGINDQQQQHRNNHHRTQYLLQQLRSAKSMTMNNEEVAGEQGGGGPGRPSRAPFKRTSSAAVTMICPAWATADPRLTPEPRDNNNVPSETMIDNPVDSIRKQLEKLEDLGDQLPSYDAAYTLPYPFQDKSPSSVSAELEFFRHRIHVERDSIKRAKIALRQQKSAFESRQQAWKEKNNSKLPLEQLVEEQRELSEMEVRLHKTRSLLGEKIIYLRHLEESLQRWSQAQRMSAISPVAAGASGGANKSEEGTLSDVSSASSGFSSTELASTDTFIEPQGIVATLESLNSEIREIWDVLKCRGRSVTADDDVPSPGARNHPASLMSCQAFSSTPRHPITPHRHQQHHDHQLHRSRRHHHHRHQHHHHHRDHHHSHPADFLPDGIPALPGSTPPNIQANLLSQLINATRHRHHHQPLTPASSPAGPVAQNIVAQYGPNSNFSTSFRPIDNNSAAAQSFLERTKMLKDWLRQARSDIPELASPAQATL